MLGFRGEVSLKGDSLLDLREVGSLAGEAALDLFAGEGLRADLEAERLVGDFLESFGSCGADGMLVFEA